MVYLFLAFDIYLGSTVLFENDSSRSIVRFLLIEYTISPRPPLLSPTNFRNSEQSTTRGNRPLLETIRSSSTILFPLHTDRGAFRLSGVRTLGERSGQRAALRVLETPLLRSRSSRSWFILNVAERIELIRFRETVGKNITRIYIYIYPIFAITKITRGAFRFELFTVRLFRMNGLFYRRRKLRIFWKRFKSYRINTNSYLRSKICRFVNEGIGKQRVSMISVLRANRWGAVASNNLDLLGRKEGKE